LWKLKIPGFSETDIPSLEELRKKRLQPKELATLQPGSSRVGGLPFYDAERNQKGRSNNPQPPSISEVVKSSVLSSNRA
jgi:hypothetical protein